MALTDHAPKPAPAKPDTSITWRLYARLRIAPRIKVQVYIGEPNDRAYYQDGDVVEQTATLARLGKLLRKLTRTT